MWHICSCNAHACICSAALRESFRDCFDCWEGYHWYKQEKKKKKYEIPA